MLKIIEQAVRGSKNNKYEILCQAFFFFFLLLLEKIERQLGVCIDEKINRPSWDTCPRAVQYEMLPEKVRTLLLHS